MYVCMYVTVTLTPSTVHAVGVTELITRNGPSPTTCAIYMYECMYVCMYVGTSLIVSCFMYLDITYECSQYMYICIYVCMYIFVCIEVCM